MGIDFELDKLRDECGVFGIYSRDDHDVSRLTYYALYALQHRGQESAGIAVNNGEDIIFYKDMGLVNNVFNEMELDRLKGHSAVGHVRYSTTGDSLRQNAQPIVVQYKKGKMAFAHNGNLVNVSTIRKELEEKGAIFQTTVDSEVMVNLISRFRVKNKNIEDSIIQMMDVVNGAYSIVIMTPKKLIAVRDRNGIRPLCLGIIDNSHVIASESCALDAIGAKFLRDVEPGEIVVIGENGIESIQTKTSSNKNLCILEFIYFARPDSIIDGAGVYKSRIKAGRQLALEQTVDADLVIGVPESGLSAALGYSMESGISYANGLIKNRYIGRTFIQPKQNQRELSVRIKLNVMKDIVDGKRVIMVDDSIVRGTTCRRIVQLLKEAGAREVHMRVSSPPVKYPCFFGIDISTRQQLVASSKSIDDIRSYVGADSLGYLSLEGLLKTPDMPKDSNCGFCSACLNGHYPMDVPFEENKLSCG